ncbi:MAG: MmcQ/YjbR family DNA-binding protein [Actinobacteria bacterium]|nr:MmcQ/YjbR family DNA-binding protein [Actinomycetota bacterium]
MATAAEKVLAKVRAVCMDLPEVTERPSHGAPTWFIRDKKTFVMFHDDHHGDGILGIWAAAAAGAQEALIRSDPSRYYRPAYVGHRGWVGMRLEGKVDWGEVESVIEDAYRTVAPKPLVAQLDRLVAGKE